MLFHERIYIIEKGEKEAEKKIDELRSGSVDDIKKELITLKVKNCTIFFFYNNNKLNNNNNTKIIIKLESSTRI